MTSTLRLWPHGTLSASPECCSTTAHAWDYLGTGADTPARRQSRLAWRELFMFPNTCLGVISGGRGKQRRNHNLAANRLERGTLENCGLCGMRLYLAADTAALSQGRAVIQYSGNENLPSNLPAVQRLNGIRLLLSPRISCSCQ